MEKEMNKERVLSYIPEYLKKIDYEFEKKGKVINLLCPFCRDKKLTAQVIENTSKIHCLNCKKRFSLITIVRKHKKEKWSKEKILRYLIKVLKIKIVDESKIKEMFLWYKSWDWCLIPIAKNSKVPIEKGWNEKEHKEPEELLEWIRDGLNVGVCTGKKSNITMNGK